MNTNNIPLSYYYGKQSYKYYIEFVEQLMDENIDCLQLTTNDAILFTYKKTIFDLNKNYIKEKNISVSDSNNNEYTELNDILQIYKTLFEYILDNIHNISDLNSHIKDYTSKLILNIYLIISISNYINSIQLFIRILINQHVSYNKVLEYLDKFVNIINKTKPDNIILYAKMCSCKTITDINNELNISI